MGPNMTKLFIDVVGPERRHNDFSGQQYNRAEEAAEAARLISLVLSIIEISPWVGSEVQV